MIINAGNTAPLHAKLLKLKGNSSKFLSTIQVAITLSGFLGSAYAADNFAGPLVGLLEKIGVPLPTETLTSICVFFITIILSYFSIVFGELVPKRVAQRKAEQLALSLSGLISSISRAFSPLVWLLTASTNGVLRLFGIHGDEDVEDVTEEEIISMVNEGHEQGVLLASEAEMITNIFEFVYLLYFCFHITDIVKIRTFIISHNYN